MKRLVCLWIAAALAVLLCACGAAGTDGDAASPALSVTAEPAAEPTPTAPPAPGPTDPPAAETEAPAPALPEVGEGWEEVYLAFLEDNFDILAALWPDGLTGVGFIDLDIDGVPEMLLFDAGASATMGVQLFDVTDDGSVVCVSSARENAAGAFGDEYFSRVSVCASFFESFRLSRTGDGYCFWVDSANGSLESSWDELVRFDRGENGIMVPVSVCERYLESDAETGETVAERYAVGGQEADAAAYDAALAVYADADTGYEAKGVFLWNDMQRYDTSSDGLLAMARDAAEAYAPISFD